MGIPLRTEEEIVKLREACKLASDVLVMIEPYVKEGVTTGELDRICHDYMVNVQKVIPACLNYHGFPKLDNTRIIFRKVGIEICQI